MTTQNKYILCIPIGGFNDIMNQIKHCYEFAKKTNRILFINCKYNYIQNFSNYFHSDYKNIIYDNNIIENIINQQILSIYPDIINYDDLKNQSMFFFLMKNKEAGAFSTLHQQLDLDILNNYDIIIHESGGGGMPINVFNYFVINDDIYEIMKNKYKTINGKYLGIHIRNTDRTSNVDELIQKSRKAINRYDNIFISTDNYQTLDYLQKSKYFYRKNIISFCSFNNIENNNQPLHLIYTNNNTVIEMLIDLYLLCNSTELIIDKSELMGGFSWLACRLFKFKLMNPGTYQKMSMIYQLTRN